MHLRKIQGEVKKRYYHIDCKSGDLFLLSVMIEEVGELARAIRKKTNVDEELVDCLFVLISLANLYEVDLTEGLRKKYLEKDPSNRWNDLPE
jgi:NTP pyrophosphatase (non-canonical NTP hydrolase)